MSHNPNVDRSNSMNPNNDEYWNLGGEEKSQDDIK